jgi:hypothetical protein
MSEGVWRAWLTEAKKPIDVRALSTVFGFINAVKNAHTKKNERLSENVCMLIKKYEAYKRTVSKPRQKCIIAATEGSIYGKLCKLVLYPSENHRNYSSFVHTRRD